MEEYKEPTVKDIFNTLTDEQKNVVYILAEHVLNHKTILDSPDKEKNVEDFFGILTEEQKYVVYCIIGWTLKNGVMPSLLNKRADYES